MISKLPKILIEKKGDEREKSKVSNLK